MLVDTDVVNSPSWWVARLVRRLVNEQRPRCDFLQRMYLGDHPLSDSLESKEDADSFREFLQNSQSNYLALVVESVIERQFVESFRGGPEDIKGDSDSLKLWNQSHLDADQIILYRTVAAMGLGYVMVADHPRRDGILVTIEDPRYTITESYPDDRREMQAGVKLWTDADGYLRATLMMPTAVYQYRSQNKALGDSSFEELYSLDSVRSWDLVETSRNRWGKVTIVPFHNRESVDGKPRGEFEDVIHIQKRLNTTLLHRLVGEKFGAFRKTAIMNLVLDPPEDDDGTPIPPFIPNPNNPEGDEIENPAYVENVPELPAHPGAVWLLQGENLRIWESQQTSTGDTMQGVAEDIRDIAAITRTPPHYLLNGIVNASGDALKAAETGLVSKVKERNAQAGESWEIVLRLMHYGVGDLDRSDEDSPLEVVWRDVESRSLSEVSDAVLKQGTAGVPWRARMAKLGYTAPEIDRMDVERTQDAMLLGLSAPEPVVQTATAQAIGTGRTPATYDPDLVVGEIVP